MRAEESTAVAVRTPRRAAAVTAAAIPGTTGDAPPLVPGARVTRAHHARPEAPRGRRGRPSGTGGTGSARSRGGRRAPAEGRGRARPDAGMGIPLVTPRHDESRIPRHGGPVGPRSVLPTLYYAGWYSARAARGGRCPPGGPAGTRVPGDGRRPADPAPENQRGSRHIPARREGRREHGARRHGRAVESPLGVAGEGSASWRGSGPMGTGRTGRPGGPHRTGCAPGPVPAGRIPGVERSAGGRRMTSGPSSRASRTYGPSVRAGRACRTRAPGD